MASWGDVAAGDAHLALPTVPGALPAPETARDGFDTEPPAEAAAKKSSTCFGDALATNSRDGLNLQFKQVLLVGGSPSVQARRKRTTPSSTPSPSTAPSDAAFAVVRSVPPAAASSASPRPLPPTKKWSRDEVLAWFGPVPSSAAPAGSPDPYLRRSASVPSSKSVDPPAPAATMPDDPPAVIRKRGADKLRTKAIAGLKPDATTSAPSSRDAGAGVGAGVGAGAGAGAGAGVASDGAGAGGAASPPTSPSASVLDGESVPDVSDSGPASAKLRKVGSEASATRVHAPIEELTEARLEKRQRQIDIGKSTEGYRRYCQLVPKRNRNSRRQDHPRTPNKHLHCSKRQWDGKIRKWRRLLHLWDPVDSTPFSPAAPALARSASCPAGPPAVVSPARPTFADIARATPPTTPLR